MPQERTQASNLPDPERLDFGKMGGLLPAVVQDAGTLQVLMLGFMNREALEATIANGRVTFWSRSKERLWTKGETSGNYLAVESIAADCDNDTLLIRARPAGAVCHNGTWTCFGEERHERAGDVLDTLARTIAARRAAMPEGSYTTSLFAAGTPRIAQKVGEEAVETVIAAMKGDPSELQNESVDLLYHLLVLFEQCGISLSDVCAVLAGRMGPR
ncbi:MAG TPA: bifunctional phosphoribosyl-AMP cyclohydrolase/phosphoribosyl-ATP diphosphatase HisIE [Candidatus Kapabacteria bacterium]|nr:bifunctional phosphoribosyl-AMP cyclohydrolase/phosphoribosyl-ATP diphosphatase HisIE [Candidatus Kapabacteria bacterium]